MSAASAAASRWGDGFAAWPIKYAPDGSVQLQEGIAPKGWLDVPVMGDARVSSPVTPAGIVPYHP